MTSLIHQRIAAAVLSAALLLPASSAFGNDWTKHHSRLRGATIGAAAGSVLGPPGAAVGAVIGNGVQYARGSGHHHHHRHHARHHRHHR